MREWLNIPFSPLFSQTTMDCYELNSTVPSPGKSTAFIEFSPNGRFLAAGDWELSSLHILDRLAGFHATVSAITPAKPTALVWETSKTFYVGLGDGRFVHYQIDLRGNKLVKGPVNCFFQGVFPATAIALDAESKTLVLSVGPDVFAFRRIRATSTFYSLMDRSSKLMLFEVNSALSPISQAASISKVTPEAQHLRSRDQFVLSPTIRSSSHFVARI